MNKMLMLAVFMALLLSSSNISRHLTLPVLSVAPGAVALPPLILVGLFQRSLAKYGFSLLVPIQSAVL